MTDTLKGILEGIMIRRTQAEIADSVLPPRVDVTIYCTLTEPQQRRYDEVADMVSRLQRHRIRISVQHCIVPYGYHYSTVHDTL